MSFGTGEEFTLVSSNAGTIREGVAGDVQLHQELAPGSGRSEREAVRAAGDVRHEQRAGSDHPQPAHVGREIRDVGTLGAFIA